MPQRTSRTDHELERQFPREMEETGAEVEKEEAGTDISPEGDGPASSVSGDSLPLSNDSGRLTTERRGSSVIYSRPNLRETPLNTDAGTFSWLRMEELQCVGKLSKPDFITHPDHYFYQRDKTPPTHTPLTANTEVAKAAFDEQILFPKELLAAEDEQTHEARNGGKREIPNNGRGLRRKAR
ncbi:hypothetical protein DPEC_G00243660 [Dallia pectoralis]|uniref:Uncharacterized protein n=1 Tax=Dallia pectoralis TaxID=75939 RepID=A0ACC2FVH2_DALPE|nr:hypothetical protein DPEC_G00243660 [Dallia pectoralis]